MSRPRLLVAVCLMSLIAHAQQTTPTTAAAPQATEAETAPLPDTRQLILDVEKNALLAQSRRKDYTYHVRLEEQDFNGKGEVKKNTITDSESITIEGARVNRVVAINGKALTPEEQKKESERIDKEVAKYKERHVTNPDGSTSVTSRGDDLVTAVRILELGAFSNPRRIEIDGRPTIVLDYAGDPKAKTHNSFEGVIRDLVGTVWIDEKDHVLVRGQGHFLKDFKIGGGLLLDIHKGLAFDFRTVRIHDEIWLPASVDAEGSARILLFGSVNGRIHLVTSDYRKFRTTSTIVSGGNPVDENGNPVSTPPKPDTLHPPKP